MSLTPKLGKRGRFAKVSYYDSFSIRQQVENSIEEDAMIRRIKQLILLAILVSVGYFLLSNHIIYFGNGIKLLKKSKPTSAYTFVSIEDKRAEDILKIEDLRNDGIGDLLVEIGKLNNEEKERLEYIVTRSP